MASKDLHDEVFPHVGLVSSAITTDTVTNGSTINTQFYEAVEFFLMDTAFTDGVYTPSLQDSPDGSTWTAVTQIFTLGEPAQQEITAANQIVWIGYSGKQQYVRLVVTSTGVTSGATVVATCALGYPHFAPTDPNYQPVP